MTALLLATLLAQSAGADAVRVEAPIVQTSPSGVNLNDLVDRLAKATGVDLARPPGDVVLPVSGLAGGLTRTMLTTTLGPDAAIEFGSKSLVVRIDVPPERKTEWDHGLRELARRAEREVRRRANYGMHALKSYRPNDPTRPTVCLIHGVNSSSGGFVHMIKPLEDAGYGLVVYDFPFNRSLESSCDRFSEDWAAFRRGVGDSRPWSVVAHSMGALVARGYVEGPDYAKDVDTLIMVAPVNQGSGLAMTQTLLQLINGLQSLGGRKPSSDALAHLGDGLGEAATDMSPGSAFLKRLNARPRRAGVDYHILAGDVGIISRAARASIDAQFLAAKRQGGLLGGVTRLAVGNDLSDRLDELTDGAGDGCVSVARSKLEGVTDHVTIHANHAELIRAPLLFRDPGPVACMPYLLRWLPPAGSDKR